MLNVKIITLFPDIFPGPLGHSLVGAALAKKIWSLEVFNLRDFAHNKHNKVDDEPYGGGSGMVLKPDVMADAIESASQGKAENYQIFYPTPRGKVLTQKKIVEFAKYNNMIFVSGRYEGLDQRVIDHYKISEFSIGDYVLSGGEIAVCAFLDSLIRTLPEVLGNSASIAEESFAVGSDYENLLEYPLYTRPACWLNKNVPEELLSGNHKIIADWRLNMSKEHTQSIRPDLWEKYLKKKGK
jgi:tRNA (guanine37-N1)-methyltransferase